MQVQVSAFYTFGSATKQEEERDLVFHFWQLLLSCYLATARTHGVTKTDDAKM